MATLALSVAGAAIGSAVLPAGVSFLGATITGATIGAQVGALAGSFVDQTLFGTSGQQRNVSGPRLSDLHVTASLEGAPIPRIYGRTRIGGQMIWATNFEEEIVQSGGGGGGKGAPGAGADSRTTQTEYRYYANFAVALVEGRITGIGRVWADGKELDLTGFTYRLYEGSEDQQPDSLIIAKQDGGHAPAYRGTAYIVFERMPLKNFGNRIPQLSFELIRSVDPFEEQVRAVTLIPGAGEFVYEPDEVLRGIGLGASAPENVHTRQGASDWDVSVDQLQSTLPNAGTVSLIVSWFGTDLRCGACQLLPGVETADKTTTPMSWQVAGLSRSAAHVVSKDDGRPAYGGTPNDASVVAAIQDLATRGIKVMFTPFVLMDIPASNTLPDPYTGLPGQSAYPWRGRISVDPAPGVAGTPDKSAAAATQTSSFVGAAQVSDFAIAGQAVVYSGPAEWTLRRMVLHYAHLCKAAGGVDAFVIGSELRALTQVRDGASSYPFVAALMQLAADVKTVLGSTTKVTYAADWSEYFGHHPQDGSGDVFFHLDPLWASADIDAVAIDLYWPLADWRDGDTHLDYLAGTRAIYDLDYLKGNVTGGEGYDWYYAGQADRDAQVRTAITDGQGKPWVFRFKDIRSWWQNQHFDRPAGVEASTPTAWTAESKPIWFSEIGCPAVNKGANQPNVFIDPKSAESQMPYYSDGGRDDLIQRRYLQAILDVFDPSAAGFDPADNPLSGVYSGRMVDIDRVHLYTWDARPYPAFPANEDAWGDAENWQRGHWLSGRIAQTPLTNLVATILDDYGFADYDVSSLNGMAAGFIVDRIMSARDALQPLELAFFFDAIEADGRIRFAHRGANGPLCALGSDDLVEVKPDAELLSLTRMQETELPASAKIKYLGVENDYGRAVSESRRLVGASGRVAQAEVPIVIDARQADAISDAWLFETWAAREHGRFHLPPSRLALEPGDVLTIEAGSRAHDLRITEISEHGVREIEALSIDPAIYKPGSLAERPRRAPNPIVYGKPIGVFLDVPLLSGDEPAHAGYVAAFQHPWPGAVAFYRSPSDQGYMLKAQASTPATLGETLDVVVPGPEGRLDFATRIRVQLASGALNSVTRAAMFDGANLAAVQVPSGRWEFIQFEQADLVAPLTYELSVLLRGQGGSEEAMVGSIPAGARFVLLDQSLSIVDMTPADVGLPHNWTYGPANRDIGHSSYDNAVHAFSGMGLRPYSPVHVRASRVSGDLVIRWTRRTRIGGDNWEQVDVPLSEDIESYEVDILDSGTVLRTLVVTEPVVTYTSAQQITDFGSPQNAVDVRVHQTSTDYGRGSARAATV